jgi:hypothetical protein
VHYVLKSHTSAGTMLRIRVPAAGSALVRAAGGGDGAG